MDEGLGKEIEKKKINEDLVMFMRKRSDNDAPRYTARLKTYVDIQRKKARARGTCGEPMSASNWMFGLMNVFDRRRRAGIARRMSDASDHKVHKQDPNEKEENKSEHPGSDDDRKTSIIKASAKGMRGRKPQISSKSQRLLMSGWFTGGGRKDAGGVKESGGRKRSKSRSHTDDDGGMEGGIQYSKAMTGDKKERRIPWEMTPLKRFIAAMCRRRRRRSCRRRRRRRRSCRRRRRRRSCRRRRRRRSCRRRRRRRSCRRRRRRRC